MSGTIRFSTDGGLARITLDRPPLNVLTISMLAELSASLRRAADDHDTRVVRLDATGKAFSAGVDVGEHLGESLDPMMRALADLFAAFEAVPQPIVAVVQGAALGGGLEVLLGCDLCVAGERATFGQPEIQLGVFAPPASVLLPRLVGERAALGLLLGGATIVAAEAQRLGLVNVCVADERLEAEAAAFIGRLLGLSGAALRLAKRAVVATRSLPVRPAHEAVDRLYRNELMSTADAHEGLRSFLEKRPPTWQHR